MDADKPTRLFVFPGGMLEVTDYGDDDSGSVYVELGHPVEPADAETCAKVLRLLRDLP